MKNYYFTLLCFCLSTFFYGQIDSVLFGLSRATGTGSMATQSVYLAKINPATGVATNISTAPVGTGINIADGVIDSYNKIYYYVNQNGAVVGLSLITGNIVSSNPITNTNANYLDQMVFNCSDTTMYGLARAISTTTNSSAQTVYLARINPANGVVTNISPSAVGSGIQLMDATIDPYNKIYYYVNESGNLVGLSLTTGTIVSSQPLTNANAQYLSQMIYNRSDSTIYGLARGATAPSNPATGYVYLAKVNPSTGIVTNISSSSVATSLVASIGTIDPYNKIFYFLGPNSSFIGLSLLTGAVVSSQPMTNSNAQYLDQVVYNCNFCPHAKPASTNNNTGIKVLFKENFYAIYPNPASTSLSMEFEKTGNYKIEISNVYGQLVAYETLINSRKLDLKVSGYKKGIYYFKIYDLENGKATTQKVIID